MTYRDPERERKRKVQAQRRRTNPETQWYRDPAWRQARREYLIDHPVCVECGATSSVVDHIEPHRGDRDKFWDSTNWRPLCKPCHDSKTCRQDGGFGNAPKPDMGPTGADGFPISDAHPWRGGKG